MLLLASLSDGCRLFFHIPRPNACLFLVHTDLLIGARPKGAALRNPLYESEKCAPLPKVTLERVTATHTIGTPHQIAKYTAKSANVKWEKSCWPAFLITEHEAE
jgi:hypothetical protein